eukprot:GEMP01041937.1.p1 GENE.GEMP01041937.1~~GEMP01041937.1.p1  ORF type:complete len:209 (+),score=23.53 GEMP01041937.1:437-1063(+)
MVVPFIEIPPVPTERALKLRNYLGIALWILGIEILLLLALLDVVNAFIDSMLFILAYYARQTLHAHRAFFCTLFGMINLVPKIMLSIELFHVCLDNGQLDTFSLNRLAETAGMSMAMAVIFFIVHMLDPIAVFGSITCAYALFLEMRLAARMNVFPLSFGMGDPLLENAPVQPTHSTAALGGPDRISGGPTSFTPRAPFSGRAYTLDV